MNRLHGKKFSVFLSVASAALAVVPILYMANIGGQLAEYPAEYIPSIICAVLSIAAQIAGIVSAGKSFSLQNCNEISLRGVSPQKEKAKMLSLFAAFRL